MKIRIEIITTIEHFFKLKDSWNQLLHTSRADNLFLTWEWLYTWWTIYQDGNDLFIITVRENDKIIGIAPLYISTEYYLRFMEYRQICFIGSRYVGSEYLDFILYPSREKIIIMRILEFIQQASWDVLQINGTLTDSELHDFISTSRQFPAMILSSFSSPYLPLPESWEQLLSGLSKKKRSNVRYYRRKLHREAPTNYFYVTEEHDLDFYFEKLLQLNKKRMAEKRVDLSGTFFDHKFAEFHRNLAKRFIKKGVLKLGFLDVGGELSAVRYDLQYNGKIYSYQAGHDPNFKNKSLGSVILGYCIEDAIRNGNKEYDFLMGSESYKLEWTKQSRKQINLRCYNPRTLKARLIFIGDRLRKRTRDFIKRGSV